MELVGFYIRHFRTLSEVYLPLTKLRVLVGRNGAGKSSLLTALEAVGSRGLPFAGVQEMSLWKQQPDGLWGMGEEPISAFRLYELGDDLSGGLSVTPEDDDLCRAERAVKSDAVLELLFSTLGPDALESVITIIAEDYEPDFGQINLDRLEDEFLKAKSLFGDANIGAFFATRPREDVERLLGEHWSKYLEEQLSLRQGGTEPPIAIADLVRVAASELLKVILSSRRIAWSNQYQGVAIHRDEVSLELGDLLSEIAAHPHSGQTFFHPLDLWEGDPEANAFLRDFASSLAPGYGSRSTMSPVVDAAMQWARQAPFLIVSLSPDQGDRMPYPRHIERLTPVSMPMTDERRTEIRANLDSWQSRSLKERYNPSRLEMTGAEYNPWGEAASGPPQLAAVLAQGSIHDLVREVEVMLPWLHDHIWASTRRTVNPTIGALPEGSRWLFPPGRGKSPLEAISLMEDRTRADPWIIERKPRTWMVRPSLHAAGNLLAHYANLIAPTFVLDAGQIEIEVIEDPRRWGSDGHLNIRYGGHALDELSAGTARWVAISLRISGRRLLESKVWLPEIWSTDETQKQDFLDRLSEEALSFILDKSGFRDPIRGDGIESYGIALHALAIISGDRNHLGFEVKPMSTVQTLLLVDEPELHLHQDALLDVRNWLSSRTASMNIAAVVATHAPALMDYRPDEGRLSLLQVLPEGNTDVLDITDNLMTWLTEDAQALGIETLDGMFFYRGFLLVEGPNDEMVLRKFYGDRLESERIGVIALWGAKDKLNLTETRYLRFTRKPIGLLFDNVPTRLGDAGRNSWEKAQLRKFVEEFKGERIPCWGTGHHRLDIITTLPEPAVRRLLESENIWETFTDGWGPIEDHIRGQIEKQHQEYGTWMKSPEKKIELAKRLGLQEHGLTGPKFIKPVLDLCNDSDRPHVSLEDGMSELFDFFSEPLSDRFRGNLNN